LINPIVLIYVAIVTMLELYSCGIIVGATAGEKNGFMYIVIETMAGYASDDTYVLLKGNCIMNATCGEYVVLVILLIEPPKKKPDQSDL
jgi:hypothetical protein